MLRSGAAEHGGDLLHGVGKVVVDGGDAGEVEFGGVDGAGEYLRADGEEAAGGVGGREDDESGREKGDTGRVLPAHGNLDGVDVDGGVDEDAAAGGVGAALLQQQLHAVSRIARSLQIKIKYKN